MVFPSALQTADIHLRSERWEYSEAPTGTYAGKNSEDTTPPLLLRAHAYLLLLPTLHPVRARAFLTLEYFRRITGS